MFWVHAAIVVVALFALAWFVSGFQKKFDNPNANTANIGSAKGYAAMKDLGRNSQGGNGPGKV